jgi:hypothetical protein
MQRMLQQVVNFISADTTGYSVHGGDVEGV